MRYHELGNCLKYSMLVKAGVDGADNSRFSGFAIYLAVIYSQIPNIIYTSTPFPVNALFLLPLSLFILFISYTFSFFLHLFHFSCTTNTNNRRGQAPSARLRRPFTRR